MKARGMPAPGSEGRDGADVDLLEVQGTDLYCRGWPMIYLSFHC